MSSAAASACNGPTELNSLVWRMRFVLPLVAAVTIVIVPAAIAQQTPKAGVPDSQPPAAGDVAPKTPAHSAAQSPKVEVPDDLNLLILIRTTLIALNQADLTGNYSVLRDMAAPGFQQANNPAQLATIFADLRSRKIDLNPIAVVEPKLARPAFVNDRGMLRITGFFPTKPEQVNFDLAFLPIEGQWRLFGISVNTSQNTSQVP
jgi:hypothetical protein